MAYIRRHVMIDIHHNSVYKKAYTQLQISLLEPTAASARAFCHYLPQYRFLLSWNSRELCSHNLSTFSVVVHYFACLSAISNDKSAMGLL